ncbi:MAG: SH3 domain-containing protein [Chloroflexota bacterium]
MRRLSAVLLVVLLCTVIAAPSAAQTQELLPTGIVNTFGLNIRTLPDPLAPSLGVLSGGTSTTILATNADASWYNVRTLDGTTGWVFAQFMLVRGDMSVVPVSQVDLANEVLPAAFGLVRAIRLNVRAAPSAAAPILRVAIGGERFSLLGSTDDELWYNVEFTDGVQGWVFGEFVSFYLGAPGSLSGASVIEALDDDVPVGALTETTTFATAPGEINGLVNQPRLNVRPAPSPNTVPLLSVGFQTRVTVLGRNANTMWLFVQANGVQGWVYAPFITPNVGSFANAPVIE